MKHFCKRDLGEKHLAECIFYCKLKKIGGEGLFPPNKIVNFLSYEYD